jgi:endonuclease/exonuclease/phosphatase family metal-dependent hydrolase
MKSFDRFDYSDEDTIYFADCLKGINPDIVCLQEVHSNAEYSTASDIARQLGFLYVYDIQASPSHIDSSFNLGNAILSKYELSFVGNVQYPYPEFDLFFKDGRPAAVHHKMVQIYMLDDTMIANTQMLPLGVFGENYSVGNGAGLARQIDNVLYEKLSTPIVFCGDFNFNTPKDIYPNTYKKLKLIEGLPETLTRPNAAGLKLNPDHIFISNDINVTSSDVITVQADHYLCYVDIETK